MGQAPNHRYWFILGREPQISAAEISAVLPDAENFVLDGVILKCTTDIEPEAVIGRLGGTIKIGLETAENISEAEMAEAIKNELRGVAGKINFGISLYGGADRTGRLHYAKKIGLAIKKSLKDEGFSVRYVENKEPELSSVVVKKNGLTARGREFLITEKNKKFSLAATRAVQPFEEFGRRDFGRPGRDDVSGMLPPKLAMIMINLAKSPAGEILLDPFCGSGTVLTEAMLLGYKKIIGTDISEKAAADAKKNVEWTKDNFADRIAPDAEITVFRCDTKDLSGKINAQVSAIVTEPYLGKPLRGDETKEQILKQADELKKLYLNSFAQFAQILNRRGTVVIIMPRFKYGGGWLQMDCTDEIKKLGFAAENLLDGRQYLAYARPGQRVGREIWKFKKI